jgi:hypothetical protein
MVIQTNISLIIADTISGIIKNLPYFILIIWGIRIIAREIKIGIKNIPIWINQYDSIRMKHYQIEKALERR